MVDYPGRGTVIAVTTPHVPLYIPAEVCGTVGLSVSTPPVECMTKVLVDIRDDGVSAPKGQDVAALRQVIEDAGHKGIDLKVVVVPENPPIEAPLRDIATEVGHAYPDSTVLVVSPSFAGTYSKHYDRAILEAGQDVAKSGGGSSNPAQAAKNFVSQLQTPDFPWMTLTIGLTLVVALAAVVTRVLQVRARRSAQAEQEAAPSASSSH